MLLCVGISVPLDLGHPRRVRLGVDCRDDDHGGSRANSNLGQGDTCIAAARPAEQPDQGQETQHPQHERPQPSTAQQVLQRGRDRERALVPGSVRRRARRLARRHGEVHRGRGSGTGAAREAREARSAVRPGCERGTAVGGRRQRKDFQRRRAYFTFILEGARCSQHQLMCRRKFSVIIAVLG